MTSINSDYSYLFSSLSSSSNSSDTDLTSLLSDYSSIKNGSYGKLLKAYYAKQAEEESSSAESSESLTLTKSCADELKASTEELMEESLWEKKEVTTTDSATGEKTVTEDYDWDAITEAVENFVEDYNAMVEQAGESDTKGVLRNATWMINTTQSNENLLSKAGITIGSDNKLEVDAEALKEADISTLKTLFCGMGSYADKVAQKAGSIGKASTSSGVYTSSGTYSDTLAGLVSGRIDEEV